MNLVLKHKVDGRIQLYEGWIGRHLELKRKRWTFLDCYLNLSSFDTDNLQLSTNKRKKG